MGPDDIEIVFENYETGQRKPTRKPDTAAIARTLLAHTHPFLDAQNSTEGRSGKEKLGKANMQQRGTHIMEVASKHNSRTPQSHEEGENEQPRATPIASQYAASKQVLLLGVEEPLVDHSVIPDFQVLTFASSASDVVSNVCLCSCHVSPWFP